MSGPVQAVCLFRGCTWTLTFDDREAAQSALDAHVRTHHSSAEHHRLEGIRLEAEAESLEERARDRRKAACWHRFEADRLAGSLAEPPSASADRE